jgi:hypothetical protein
MSQGPGGFSGTGMSQGLSQTGTQGGFSVGLSQPGLSQTDFSQDSFITGNEFHSQADAMLSQVKRERASAFILRHHLLWCGP